MFSVDVPVVPPQETPIVMVRAANSTASGSVPAADYLLKLCQETLGGNLRSSGNLQDVSNSFNPANKLAVQLGNKFNRPIYSELKFNRSIIKITLLQGPEHGQLHQPYPERPSYYRYETNPGYLGKDKVVFLGEFEGKRYKVVMNLVVVKEVSPENPLTSDMEPVCPEPQLIKLKSKLDPA